jgi:prophage antirepressor-like protein
MTETALQIVTFENTDIRIVGHDGHRWALAKEVGLALGYNDHRDFYKLMQRHPEDFAGKTAVITGVGSLPTEEFRIVSYHGIIRAAMLAKTKKAVVFRDWAEDVLFTVMTQGHIDLRTPTSLELKQDAFHKDMAMLRQFIVDDPATSEWVYPRIQALWDNYASNYVEPKIAVTLLTEDWLSKLYWGLKWSKDTIMVYFPRQLTSSAEFERYRKQWNIRARNALPIPTEVAMQMFRDYYQYHMRIDAIVQKYLYYSKDTIQKRLKAIETEIVSVLANNHVYDVKRFDKKSYADYRDTEKWYNKKEVMVAPTGPFDLCWDCLRPISLSTVHLHHMTYRRVGFELWTDFRPLCAPCHAHRHAATEQTQITSTNSKGGIVIPDAMALEETERALLCKINGSRYWFPKSTILGQSEVKQNGDKGTIVVTESIAKSKGFA